MATLVRNRKSGPVVFTDRTRDFAQTWEAAGDSRGQDYQHVPNEVATDNPAFLKSVRQGIFEVVDENDAEAIESLNAQDAARVAQREAHQKAIENMTSGTQAGSVIATLSVDEAGSVSDYSELPPAPKTDFTADTGITIVGDTVTNPETGKLESEELPVIIETARG